MPPGTPLDQVVRVRCPECGKDKRVVAYTCAQCGNSIGLCWCEPSVAGTGSVSRPPARPEEGERGPGLRPLGVGGPLRLGTDFSGMEAPGLACRALRIPCEHLWLCDMADSSRRFLGANFPGTPVWPDVLARPLPAPGALDFYVAGPPCQPFLRLAKSSRCTTPGRRSTSPPSRRFASRDPGSRS